MNHDICLCRYLHVVADIAPVAHCTVLLPTCLLVMSCREDVVESYVLDGYAFNSCGVNGIAYLGEYIYVAQDMMEEHIYRIER